MPDPGEPERYTIVCTLSEIYVTTEEGKRQSRQIINVIPDRPIPSNLMLTLAIYINQMAAMGSENGYEKTLDNIQKGLAKIKVTKKKKPKPNEPEA